MALLAHSQLLAEGEEIRRVVFPQDGMVALVANHDEEPAVEVRAVGRQGMIGLPLLLGAHSYPNTRVVAQVPGHALVMDTTTFESHSGEGSALRQALLRYGQCVIEQASQAAACNRVHSLEERTAKWLLLIHDSVEGDRCQIAEEFLSHMLGAGRPSVRRTTDRFQDEGLIRDGEDDAYEVLDRRGLEDAACECYRVQAASYERVVA